MAILGHRERNDRNLTNMSTIATAKVLTRPEFEQFNQVLPVLNIIIDDWLTNHKSEYEGARLLFKQLSSIPEDALNDENNLFLRADEGSSEQLRRELSLISSEEDIERIKKQFGTMPIGNLAEKAQNFIELYRSIEDCKRESMTTIAKKMSVIAEYADEVFSTKNDDSNEKKEQI